MIGRLRAKVCHLELQFRRVSDMVLGEGEEFGALFVIIRRKVGLELRFVVLPDLLECDAGRVEVAGALKGLDGLFIDRDGLVGLTCLNEKVGRFVGEVGRVTIVLQCPGDL